MTDSHLDDIRKFVRGLLQSRGVAEHVGDSESLFVSGRLDSVASIDLIMHLESEYGVDFSTMGFDVSLIDSIAEIATLAQVSAKAA